MGKLNIAMLRQLIIQKFGTAKQFCMATLKEIRKVAERTGADPLSDDMIQWAIFCMAPGETVAANEKIIEKALKLKGA